LSGPVAVPGRRSPWPPAAFADGRERRLPLRGDEGGQGEALPIDRGQHLLSLLIEKLPDRPARFARGRGEIGEEAAGAPGGLSDRVDLVERAAQTVASRHVFGRELRLPPRGSRHKRGVGIEPQRDIRERLGGFSDLREDSRAFGFGKSGELGEGRLSR
jgi:hypothetical protein